MQFGNSERAMERAFRRESLRQYPHLAKRIKTLVDAVQEQIKKGDFSHSSIN